MTIVPEITSR